MDEYSAEKWLDELLIDHNDNHRRGLDELWGGKGAKGCAYCDEENAKAKAKAKED